MSLFSDNQCADMADMNRGLEDQPTLNEISLAWTYAIEAEDIAGARAQTRMKLEQLRDRKTTWIGKRENDLRFAIDRYLGRI